VRASAAVAFYYPVSDRKNLQLVQGNVLNLIGSDEVEGKSRTVKGVEYRDSQGNLHSISLRDSGEIILAAGALATPAILEASGVGNPSLLHGLGIKVQVNLPGAGENLQD
jgi:choline dehydrogenase